MEVGNYCVPLASGAEDEEAAFKFAIHILCGGGWHTGSGAEILRGADLANE